ncbi:hypothetical protein SAMN05421869_12261 [Nonomuraea jiangxiensis]|uniref:Cytoskeleton protein RodZ-like C-terminal domain-containing protein n=2 Tax=Nonomuraea jiangxiensis TaxID=633440 RepID=A0A1G9HCU2_9ACTN|nr:hypothetical protein SAMN05421869_12261 [Nonomuraea jiangxiensis]
MGLARLTVAVLAAGAVVTLLVIGGRALLGSFGGTPESERAGAATPAPPSTASREAAAQVPTVRIECVAATCPTVTVRVPGGDVLQYREMSGGEEVSYFEPELDVVLSDAGTVRVTVNGEPRDQGEQGTREAFTAKADDKG